MYFFFCLAWHRGVCLRGILGLSTWGGCLTLRHRGGVPKGDLRRVGKYRGIPGPLSQKGTPPLCLTVRHTHPTHVPKPKKKGTYWVKQGHFGHFGSIFDIVDIAAT